MTKKYILTENTKLRSYLDHPRILMQRGSLKLHALTTEEFLFLLLSDGGHFFEESELAKRLVKNGWIREWKEGDAPLDEWQKFKKCRNRFMPYITLEITERCNCNCLHCFNATGVAVPRKEMSYEQILTILDQAEDCGIQSVLITGGEPMLHPRVMDIFKAVHERGMFVYELNTNGTLLTDEILKELKTFSPNTKIKISYDGTGFHDTMRGMKGCEEKTLEALRKSIAAGFDTRVQIQINRLNEDTILPTLLEMDAMGVQEARITRTSESPRWSATSPGASLSWSEYYARATEITKEYLMHEPSMYIEFWLFLSLWPKSGMLQFWSIHCWEEDFQESRPMCHCTRSNIAVSAEGKVFPCLQMASAFSLMGIVLGDINSAPLQEIISKSLYAGLSSATIGDRIAHNERCRNCPFLKNCGGGCPLIGMIFNQDYYGSDNSCCIFYRDHWYEKVRQALPEVKVCTDFDPSKETFYLESFEIPDVPVIDVEQIKSRLRK